MAVIKASKRTFVEELATNPQVNLMVVCERLGAPFNDGEAEISLADKVAEKLYDKPQLVTKMLQQEAIEFLLQCWEMEGDSLVAQMYLRELEQLHFLGFLSYEDDTIYINMEAKDKFFFSLKSHRTQEQMEEYMFLGLRKTEGVSLEQFAENFGSSMDRVYKEVLERMYRLGLMEKKGEYVRLTERGIDVSNSVMSEFLL